MPKFDDRFARQNRCEPPPEFPLASPYSSIVHHLSGPNSHAHTRTPSQKIKERSAVLPAMGIRNPASLRLAGFTHQLTAHMSGILCSCFTTGEWGAAGRLARRAHGAEARRDGAAGQPRFDAVASPRNINWPGLGRAPIRTGHPRVIGRTGLAFNIRPGASRHPFASLPTIQALFDSLFKVLFIFPSRYLFAIGLTPVFSLGRNLALLEGCIPKQPESQTAPRGVFGNSGSGPRRGFTLSGAPSGTWARVRR
ncbi:hypothetical protein Tco_1227229 [Tanacetum coccineum]